jgi:hypothetical protein
VVEESGWQVRQNNNNNRQTSGNKAAKTGHCNSAGRGVTISTGGKNMNDQFSGVVRHVLTIAAGVLIQRGVLDESSAEAIVGGVIAIIGVAWSWRSKKPTA